MKKKCKKSLHNVQIIRIFVSTKRVNKNTNKKVCKVMKKFSKNQLAKSNCLESVIPNLHEHGESLYELMRGLDIEFKNVPSIVDHLQNALLELRRAEVELIERSKL